MILKVFLEKKNLSEKIKIIYYLMQSIQNNIKIYYVKLSIMVVHKCPNCKNEYHNKIQLDNHITKKSCEKSDVCNKKILPHVCKECGQTFDRKYNHDRHVQTKHINVTHTKKNETTNTINGDEANINIQDSDIKCRDIINNTNNIYVKQYNLKPFCEEDINCLSPHEQLRLLNNKGNLMETIIIQINLNPNVPDNHNCYLTNAKNGQATVFDGKCWKQMTTNAMLEMLCAAREKDLWNIYKSCHMYISPDDAVELNKILIEIGYFLRPDKSNSFHLDSKKILKGAIKTCLANRCNLGIEAHKNTKHLFKEHSDVETPKNNMFEKEGFTIDDVVMKIKRRSEQLEICKLLLGDLSKRLDKEIYDSLELFIDKTYDHADLNTIIILLTESLWKNTQINIQIITKALETQKSMNVFMKEKYPNHFI